MFEYKAKPKSSKYLIGIALGLVVILGILSLSSVSNSRKSLFLQTFEVDSQEFEEFMHRFSKSYSTPSEKSFRFLIFLENSSYIRVSNSLNRSYTSV